MHQNQQENWKKMKRATARINNIGPVRLCRFPYRSFSSSRTISGPDSCDCDDDDAFVWGGVGDDDRWNIFGVVDVAVARFVSGGLAASP